MLVPYSFTVASPFPVSGPSPKYPITSCIRSHNHLKTSHNVLHDPTNLLKHSVISLLFPMGRIIISFCSPPSYELQSSGWFLQQAAISGGLGCSLHYLSPVLGICISICDLLLVLSLAFDFCAHKWGTFMLQIYMHPYIPHILTVKIYGRVSEWSEEENPQGGNEAKYSGSCKRKNKLWFAWIEFQLLSCP